MCRAQVASVRGCSSCSLRWPSACQYQLTVLLGPAFAVLLADLGSKLFGKGLWYHRSGIGFSGVAFALKASTGAHTYLLDRRLLVVVLNTIFSRAPLIMQRPLLLTAAAD